MRRGLASTADGVHVGTKKKVDLAAAFAQRQRALTSELGLPLDLTTHPTALGDAAEANWRGMLKSILPGRYEVGPIFAMDSNGQQSDQIDIAIYDRQYAPLWFTIGSNRIVPIESVYAVLEVKPEINARNLQYAADKVASVRELERKSGRIVDIYGTQEGVDLETRPIIGGLLALRSGWKDGLSSGRATTQLLKHSGAHHLDLGLALTDGAFDHVSSSANLEMVDVGLTYSPTGAQLIFFTMRLFRRLQSIGTAPAVDLAAYDRLLALVEPGAFESHDDPAGIHEA
jgi:hypothetical protein